MREEANIAQMLLCPGIRLKTKGVIEPWMFETEVYRAFALCIINEKFDKETIDTNLLKIYIKNKYPSLRESDFLEIQRLIDDFNEIEEDDEKFVLNIMADFFRKKIYSKGLQYIANDEIQKAEDYIVRATNLNFSEKEYVNLANKEKILNLLERKFPKDGKYFKSSFGLINENSTFDGYRRGDLVQIVAPTGRGKAVCIHSSIPTPTGWKTAGEVKEGEFLIGKDGKPTKVLGVYPQGVTKNYKVTFSDRTSIVCCENHLWSVKTADDRKRKKPYRTLSVKELLQKDNLWRSNGPGKNKSLNYSIPMCDAVDYSEKNLPIDPYVLGFLLGDGYLPEKGSLVASVAFEDVDFYSSYMESYCRRTKDTTTAQLLFDTNFKSSLIDLNLIGKKSGDKFIPEIYKQGSIKQRKALLAGLLDTDGHCQLLNSKKKTGFTSTSKQLTLDIIELITSLGGIASYYEDKRERYSSGFCGRVSFQVPFNPFRLTRKNKAYESIPNTPITRKIYSIELVEPSESVCFTVDAEDSLFLVGKDFTVTHNTSMMCQEAVTLAHQGFKVGYAIIGDNEQDDIAIKFCSYLSKTPIDEVVDNLGGYIDKYSEYLSSINAIDYPMYSITISELLSDFKRIKNKEGLDVFFVDYDQNIAMAHESMYESGGLIYGALKAFAQVEDCVVMVASQPKIDQWGKEVIGAEGANESSKKQANVDMIITFNWNPECKKVGSLHLAKIRRGTCEVVSKIKFNHHISELKEISKAEYDYILSTYKALEEGLDINEQINFGG